MKQQPIELRKLRDFGQVISDTFLFFKENFKPLLKCLFTICGLFLLLGTVTATAQYLNMANVISFKPDPNNFQHFTASYFLSAFLNGIIVLLSQSCIHLVTLCYVSVYLQNGREPTLPEVWGFFKYFFWRVVGSGILIVIMLAVGLMLCVFPGIYLGPIFALIIPIIVLENASFSYSFNKSFTLIKNNWWFVFGVIFVMGIIVVVCVSVASLPLSAITLLGKYLSLTSIVSVPLTILFCALYNLLTLAYSLAAIAVSLVYFDLSEQKEGMGLLNRIENFGKGNHDTSALPAEDY